MKKLITAILIMTGITSLIPTITASADSYDIESGIYQWIDNPEAFSGFNNNYTGTFKSNERDIIKVTVTAYSTTQTQQIRYYINSTQYIKAYDFESKTWTNEAYKTLEIYQGIADQTKAVTYLEENTTRKGTVKYTNTIDIVGENISYEITGNNVDITGATIQGEYGAIYNIELNPENGYKINDITYETTGTETIERTNNTLTVTIDSNATITINVTTEEIPPTDPETTQGLYITIKKVISQICSIPNDQFGNMLLLIIAITLIFKKF